MRGRDPAVGTASCSNAVDEDNGQASSSLAIEFPLRAQMTQAEATAAVAELPPAPAVVGGDEVGFLRGNVGVSAMGAATYHLALPVPPGRLGIEPSLSISYASSGGESRLGRGWSIGTGTNVIRRCGATLEFDAVERAVQLDDQDRLCLNGRRLTAVEGAYWAVGTIYKTEENNYARIEYLGGHFKISHQDGRLEWLGYSPFEESILNSRQQADNAVQFAWHTAEVRDRFDNVMTYHWHREQNTRTDELDSRGRSETENHRLEKILYGQRPSPNAQSAKREIRFVYQERVADRSFGWHLGARRSAEWLVARIEVRTTAVGEGDLDQGLTYDYRFTYNTPTDSERAQLQEIERCARNGVCQQPTTFVYEQQPRGFASPITVSNLDPSSGIPTFEVDGHHPLVLDANGDGRSDLATYEDGRWYISLADPSNLTGGQPFLPRQGLFPGIQEMCSVQCPPDAPVCSPLFRLPCHLGRGFVLDFNVDGRDDLLLLEDSHIQGKTGASATWRVALSQGDGTFTIHDTNVDYPHCTQRPEDYDRPDDATWPRMADCALTRSRRTHVLDFDGDGYPDLLTYAEADPDRPTARVGWHVRLHNRGGSFEPVPLFLADAVNFQGESADPTEDAHVLPFDIENDGKVEVLYRDTGTSSGKYYLARYESGNLTQQEMLLPGVNPFCDAKEMVKFIDVNGDGLTDAVYHNPSQRSQCDTDNVLHYAFLNTGRNFRGNRHRNCGPAGGCRSYAVISGFVLGSDNELREGSLHSALNYDYNGDGITDLLIPQRTRRLDGLDPATVSPTRWKVLRSVRGTNHFEEDHYEDHPSNPYFRSETLTIPFDVAGQCDATTIEHEALTRAPGYPRQRIIDYNGDLIGDLLQVTCGSYRVYRGLGARDGLLKEVWEGRSPTAGQTPTVALSYASSTDERVHVRTGSDATCATHPELSCVTPKMYLVDGVTLDRGETASPSAQSYTYEDFGSWRTGRRPAGFRAIEIRHHRTAGFDTGGPSPSYRDTIVRREFELDLANLQERRLLAGRIARETVTTPTSPSTDQISTTDTDWAMVPHHAGVFGVYVASQTTKVADHEPNGTSTFVSHQRATSDAPDVYGIVETSQVDVLDADEAVYHSATRTIVGVNPDESAWLIGRPDSVTTTRTAHGESVLSEIELDYDPTNGALAYSKVTLDAEVRIDEYYFLWSHGLPRRTDSYSTGSIGLESEWTLRRSNFFYDADGLFLTVEQDPMDRRVVRRVDGVWGIPLVERTPDPTTIAPDGATDRITIDRYGQIVGSTFADGSRVEVHRELAAAGDDHRYAIEVSGPDMPSARVEYGRLGQVLRERGDRLLGTSHIQTEYDSQGRVRRRSEPSATATAEHWTTAFYDGFGRPVKTVRPDGRESLASWRGLQATFTDPAGQVTRHERDPAGELAAVIDAHGSRTEYVVGPDGEPRRITNPDGDEIAYAYNAYGLLTSIDDPNLGLREFGYGDYGLLNWTRSPEHGQRTFHHDLIGRVREIEDADGVTEFTFSDDEQHLIETVSPFGVTQSLEYDPITDQLLSVSQTEHPTASPIQIDFTYTSTGLLDTIRYPADGGGQRLAVRQRTDGHGFVTAIENIASGENYWEAVAANARGQIVTEEFGNGVGSLWSFAASNGDLIEQQSYGPNGPFQGFRYGYDAVGSLVFREESVTQIGEVFETDALHRLTRVRRCGAGDASLSANVHGIATANTGSSCSSTSTVSYDRIGNISVRSDITTSPYVYDPQRPHAVSRIESWDGLGNPRTLQFAYDTNGNQAVRSVGNRVAALTYTAADRPRSITTTEGGATEAVSFAYDAEGERVAKYRCDGFTCSHDSPTLESASVYLGDWYRRDDGTKHHYFIRAHGRTVAVFEREGTQSRTRYLHVDHLGSVTAQTDEAGEETIVSYDVWGQARSTDWQADASLPLPTTSHGFIGEENDDDLGLINLNARLYDPLVGRFISPDPIIPDPTNLQAFNRYSYVYNNPMSLTDPSGYSPNEEVIRPDDVRPDDGGGGFPTELIPDPFACPYSECWIARKRPGERRPPPELPLPGGVGDGTGGEPGGQGGNSGPGGDGGPRAQRPGSSIGPAPPGLTPNPVGNYGASTIGPDPGTGIRVFEMSFAAHWKRNGTWFAGDRLPSEQADNRIAWLGWLHPSTWSIKGAGRSAAKALLRAWQTVRARWTGQLTPRQRLEIISAIRSEVSNQTRLFEIHRRIFLNDKVMKGDGPLFLQLIEFRKQGHVALDWLKALRFGRDLPASRRRLHSLRDLWWELEDEAIKVIPQPPH